MSTRRPDEVVPAITSETEAAPVVEKRSFNAEAASVCGEAAVA